MHQFEQPRVGLAESTRSLALRASRATRPIVSPAAAYHLWLLACSVPN
jgi:hypothetical protein